jgi:hypothetical protein
MTNSLPFDADAFSLQARSALNSLQHVMQVVINAGALLEQELGRPLDPPAPRRFLYPRTPEKTRNEGVAAMPDAPPADSGAGMDGAGPTAPARRLQELHARPPSARFTTAEAAAYLNCSENLLRSWRWQGRGPPFDGAGRLVRYTKASLDKFMTA